jgi:hypothetical protein
VVGETKYAPLASWVQHASIGNWGMGLAKVVFTVEFGHNRRERIRVRGYALAG